MVSCSWDAGEVCCFGYDGLARWCGGERVVVTLVSSKSVSGRAEGIDYGG